MSEVFQTNERMRDRVALAGAKSVLQGMIGIVPSAFDSLINQAIAEAEDRLSAPLFEPASVPPIPTNHLRHLLDGEPLNTVSKGDGATA